VCVCKKVQHTQHESEIECSAIITLPVWRGDMRDLVSSGSRSKTLEKEREEGREEKEEERGRKNEGKRGETTGREKKGKERVNGKYKRFKEYRKFAQHIVLFCTVVYCDTVQHARTMYNTEQHAHSTYLRS
jgi:hypothetical protein